MTSKVTKALTLEELARVEARQNASTATAIPSEAVAVKPKPQFVGGKLREQELPLVWPLEYDGVVYEKLTVRRLKGTDFQVIAGFKDAEEAVKMAAYLTGAPEEVIAALDAEDFIELQSVIQSFIPPKMQAVAGQISGNGQSTQQ